MSDSSESAGKSRYEDHIKGIHMVQYNSPEDLLIGILDETVIKDNILLGNGFQVHFKICGQSWDGKFDFRAAQIILNAQKDFLSLISLVSGKKYTLSSKEVKNTELRITGNFEKGSLEAILDYAEPILGALKMLPAAHQTILLCTIVVSMFGYFCFKNRNETKIRLEEIEQKSEENKGRIQESLANISLKSEELKNEQTNFDKIIKLSERFISPLRIIANHMRDDDIIMSNNRQITRDEVRENLPSVIQDIDSSEIIPHWVDDEFTIDVWDIKKSQLTIRDSSNNILKPIISFINDDDKAIFKSLLPEPGSDTMQKVYLRIYVLLNDDGHIINSFIVQVNPSGGKQATLASLLEPRC